MPLFSVIIATYNHAHLIKKCLDSLLSQTFTDWEAIIVNNYSGDNTIDVVNEFKDSRIRLINFRNHGVIAASRNEGIRNSMGDWICILDSDDWWYPDKLEKVKKYINEYDVIYHDLIDYDAHDHKMRTKRKGRQLKSPVFKDLLLNENAIPNSSSCARKEFIKKVSGISEDKQLIAVEDFDLWLRISEITEKFKYIPEILGAYWRGGGNITEVSIRQLKRRRAVFVKHWKKLSKADRHKVLINLFYTRGRIYQKLGMKLKARKCFCISKHSHIFSIKIKSVYSFLSLIKN
ncbi:MAG: glycosyltransferase [Spirochaetia bacterium]|nr:glycosyltransferase [Spirochaetia bacterium]